MQPMFVAMTLLLAMTMATATVTAQTQSPTPSPAPGPTNPAPNPQAQPGATIVINPTQQECQSGWNASLRWTQEQFREFCTMLGSSK